MTVKQRILQMIERLPDDVGYDRVLYHLGVMKDVEIGLVEAEQGEGLDHDQVFMDLIAENANNTNPLDSAGKY